MLINRYNVLLEQDYGSLDAWATNQLRH